MDDAGDALRVTWPASGRQVRLRWSQLTEQDIEAIGGDSQHLVSRLQERCGYSRERAEREAQELIDDLDAVLAPRPRPAPEREMPSGNARAPGSPAPQSRTARASHVPPPGTSGSAGSDSG
jgi:uncharacterized protein YjbJ (UPF0337 family)